MLDRNLIVQLLDTFDRYFPCTCSCIGRPITRPLVTLKKFVWRTCSLRTCTQSKCHLARASNTSTSGNKIGPNCWKNGACSENSCLQQIRRPQSYVQSLIESNRHSFRTLLRSIKANSSNRIPTRLELQFQSLFLSACELSADTHVGPLLQAYKEHFHNLNLVEHLEH